MLSGMLQSAKKKIRKVQHAMDIYRLGEATVDLGNVSSVHFSLADVHQVFIDAQGLHPESLFDLPLLSELKRLNELYGAKFTLYCFEDSAYRLSDEYFAEIKANENWLQVGYHAGIDGNVTVESYQRFRSYFSEQKIKLALSLRLHYFDCPEELKIVLKN